MGVGWLANKQNPRHRWNSEKPRIIKNYGVMRAGAFRLLQRVKVACCADVGCRLAKVWALKIGVACL